MRSGSSDSERVKKAQHLAQKMEQDYINLNLNQAKQVLIEEKIGDYYYGYTENYIKVKTKSNVEIGKNYNFLLGNDKNFEIIKKDKV